MASGSTSLLDWGGGVCCCCGGKVGAGFYTKKRFIRLKTTYIQHYKLMPLINNNSTLVKLPVLLVYHHSLTISPPSSRHRMAQWCLHWHFLSCGACGHTRSIGHFTRWGTVGAFVSRQGWWCRLDRRAYLHGWGRALWGAT